jgi:hypothetical protein
VLYIKNIISKEDLIYQDELQSNLHYEVSFGTKKKWPYKTGDLFCGKNNIYIWLP